MRRVIRNLIFIITLVTLGFSTTTHAAPSYTPVTRFVAADSVLGTYYTHFVNRYGKNYPSKEATFQAFCRVLRQSDLLSEELHEAGIPVAPIQATLLKLENSDLNGESHDSVQRSLLMIDYALESIESGIVPNHRGEFRREVLAEVPPLAYNG